MANDVSSNPYILDTPNVVPPVMAAPSQAVGGAFAAGNTFWVLTAVNAFGETLQSNEVTLLMVLNNKATLNWAVVPGAASYVLYRSLSSGVYTGGSKVNVAISPGSVVTIDDPGAALISGDPPLVGATGDLLVPTAGAPIKVSKFRWVVGTGGVAGDTLRVTDSANKVKWEKFNTVTAATTAEEDAEASFFPPLALSGLRLPAISRGKLYVYLNLGA